MELDGSPITIGGENIAQNYKEFRKFWSRVSRSKQILKNSEFREGKCK